MAAARSRTAAHHSPALVLLVVPVAVTHSLSMTSRPLLYVRAKARTVACRRRAFESCGRVVTDLRQRRDGSEYAYVFGEDQAGGRGEEGLV
jgi:hypothetical protein